MPHKRWIVGLGTWLAATALLAALCSGCASSGQVGSDIWTSLSPAERAEADVLEQAMAKLAAHCREQNPADPCVPPKVYAHGDGTTPRYGPGHIISIPRLALDPRLRSLTAHELSHAWFADARELCQTDQVQCERNANVHGIEVLMIGYGSSEERAAGLMRALLVAMVTSHAKTSRAHPDWCAELHDYQRRVYAASVNPYSCEEVAAK